MAKEEKYDIDLNDLYAQLNLEPFEIQENNGDPIEVIKARELNYYKNELKELGNELIALSEVLEVKDLDILDNRIPPINYCVNKLTPLILARKFKNKQNFYKEFTVKDRDEKG